MATIDDVLAWAASIPPWQGDAVRRVLIAGNEPLGAEDYSEILALARAELKLAAPPETLKPVILSAGQFTGVPASRVAVKLVSITGVSNVNIIKAGHTLSVAEDGVTVIYGDNGSGKSGYSRILKLACHARDKDERILTDVYATPPPGTPAATLNIKQDSLPKSINWKQDTPPDSILSNITVFDGRCARVITDNRNEVTYLPFGGDVFQKTAEVVLRVKAEIEAEIESLVPLQDSAVTTGTPSAIFLGSLSENTEDEEIEKATAWSSSDDDVELADKEELARTSDSTRATQEVARLEKIKERVSAAINASTKLLKECVGLGNETIARAVGEVNAAKLARGSALAERQTPEVLPGVGSTNEWEILYKAAKQYSEQIAYPGQPFPKTRDAICVLCQQPLNDQAIARFERFKKFMEDATSAALEGKLAYLAAIRERIERIVPLSGAPLESICDEITALDSAAAESLRVCHAGVVARKSAVLSLLREGADHSKFADVEDWPSAPDAQLQRVVQALTQQAADITNSAKPDEYQKLKTTVAELKARKALSFRRNDIRMYVAKSRRNGDLRRAAGLLRTQEITRQGTTIVRKNLTPELISAVKAELEELGATRVPISVKPSGASGETAHEMLLEGAISSGKARTSQVLSEGEARVVAIAGFLAELQLAPHTNGIVLDDPVSSLDRPFTEKIAARLAREGLKRQVIVFTHNIEFLMELDDAREALAKMGTPVPLSAQTLHRSGKSSGIVTDGPPWGAMRTPERAQYLEQQVHAIKSKFEDNIAEYNRAAAEVYGFLREAWESCVEDDLLVNVACRHRSSVHTLRLMEVTVEDIDCHEIDLHMTKTSKWMTGHDKSKSLSANRPAPTELLADINALRAFAKRLNERRKTTRKRREDQLEAPTSQ